MKRDENIKRLLRSIENAARRKIQWTVQSLQSPAAVGDVQIVLYSPSEDAPEVQIFKLPDGLTPEIEAAITTWFKSFLDRWGLPIPVNAI